MVPFAPKAYCLSTLIPHAQKNLGFSRKNIHFSKSLNVKLKDDVFCEMMSFLSGQSMVPFDVEVTNGLRFKLK